jgi:polysaccharide export outer membrane protein
MVLGVREVPWILNIMNISIIDSGLRVIHAFVRRFLLADAAVVRFLAGFLAASAGILLVGCESSSLASKQAPEPISDATTYGRGNVLHEGDLLEISFQYSSNYNTTQKISFDGTINLQPVGQIKAAGQTTAQLETELTKLYSPLVKEDVITVKVLAPSASIYVSGSVMRPGKIPLERPMTVMEAIMEAGGFDPVRARLSDVVVLRVESGCQTIHHINLKRVLHGDYSAPFYLRPFDIVHVPTKTFSF